MPVVDLPRRWRWAIALACAVVLGLALLFVASARHAAEVAPVVPGVQAPVAAVTADEPVPEAVATAASASHGADAVQVCGGAWVKTQADGSLDPAEFERATQLPQARERILAKLRASPNELARASIWLLAMLGADRQRRLAAPTGAPDCEGAGCAASPEAMSEVAQARDALARLAVSTSDPRVYALAFKFCGGNSNKAGEGACRMLSAEQWAHLDPGNAAPWLFMLSSAKAHDDRAVQDEVLFRIASARRSDVGFFAVAGAILEATPDDDPSQLAAFAMVTEAIGMEAAVALPAMQPMTSACRGSALRDANRAQVCAGIAELLADRSDTLLERMIGVAIGRQIGWPAERVDRMRGEYSAYANGMSPLESEVKDFGCAPIRRDLDRVRRQATLGEAGALRAWVAASGKRPEDFVREERSRQQLARASEEAAAASAAASAALIAAR